MIQENNKLSIIVVNWNGERLLKSCLGALFAQSYSNYEIVLVDNGSSDNSFCLARKDFPQVKIVALKENRGFTGSNSAGLEVAQERYIGLVNNDTRVDQRWLENLLRADAAKSRRWNLCFQNSFRRWTNNQQRRQRAHDCSCRFQSRS